MSGEVAGVAVHLHVADVARRSGTEVDHFRHTTKMVVRIVARLLTGRSRPLNDLFKAFPPLVAEQGLKVPSKPTLVTVSVVVAGLFKLVNQPFNAVRRSFRLHQNLDLSRVGLGNSRHCLLKVEIEIDRLVFTSVHAIDPL